MERSHQEIIALVQQAQARAREAKASDQLAQAEKDSIVEAAVQEEKALFAEYMAGLQETVESLLATQEARALAPEPTYYGREL